MSFKDCVFCNQGDDERNLNTKKKNYFSNSNLSSLKNDVPFLIGILEIEYYLQLLLSGTIIHTHIIIASHILLSHCTRHIFVQSK